MGDKKMMMGKKIAVILVSHLLVRHILV